MKGLNPNWWELWKRRPGGSSQSGGRYIGRRYSQLPASKGYRGRRYPKVHHPKPRSVIIKSKFVALSKYSGRRLGIWLDYCSKDMELKQELERDERTPEMPLRDREFFDGQRTGLSKDEAVERIKENFGTAVAYHQMILSPGDREIDPIDYARDQMQALEKSLGHSVTWVANVHRDTGPDKTHINVTIAGAIPEHQRPLFGEKARTEQERERDDQESARRHERGDADPRSFERPDHEREFENHTDRLAHELTEGKVFSPEGVRYTKEANRACDYVEWRQQQGRIKNLWNERGDVYITRDSLDAMRADGNYYVHRERNFDREIERAIELELGKERDGRERTLEHDRESTIGWSHAGDAHSDRDRGGEEFRRNEPGITGDTGGHDASDDRRRRRDDESGEG